MKTFDQLCKDVVKVVEDRVQAESPAIKDTPGRRFAVFQTELAALLEENQVTVTAEELAAAAQKYAYPAVSAQVAEATDAPPEAKKPASADDIVKNFVKSDGKQP